MDNFPVGTNQLKKSCLKRAVILMRKYPAFSKYEVKYALPKKNLNN